MTRWTHSRAGNSVHPHNDPSRPEAGFRVADYPDTDHSNSDGTTSAVPTPHRHLPTGSLPSCCSFLRCKAYGSRCGCPLVLSAAAAAAVVVAAAADVAVVAVVVVVVAAAAAAAAAALVVAAAADCYRIGRW